MQAIAFLKTGGGAGEMVQSTERLPHQHGEHELNLQNTCKRRGVVAHGNLRAGKAESRGALGL